MNMEKIAVANGEAFRITAVVQVKPERSFYSSQALEVGHLNRTEEKRQSNAALDTSISPVHCRSGEVCRLVVGGQTGK